MKQLEIKAIQQISTQHGIKKMRRLGHSYAFEQIKDYVPGDDYRSINWKASSRKGEWMVNQYEDERALPALRKIARFHLLVVVFFENTEVAHFATQLPQSVEDIYLQTAAKKYLYDTRQIAQILSQYGIQTVYTKPEDLSVNTLNKYLELKARGMI